MITIDSYCYGTVDSEACVTVSKVLVFMSPVGFTVTGGIAIKQHVLINMMYSYMDVMIQET